MADIHIADFYKDSARILIQLYSQFPRPTLLFVEDIAGPDTPDDFGLHSERHQACLATMLWLAKAGYIHYESLVRQEALDQVTLTQRGFTLLASRLPVVDVPGLTTADEEQSINDQPVPETVTQINGANLLRQVLQHGSSMALEQVMLTLFHQARHHL